jgi:DNA-binding protein H-NS
MPRRISLKTLEQRIRALKLQAEEIRHRDNNPALRKIVKLAKRHGFSIGELRRAMNGRGTGRGGPKLRGRKVKPMYRDPKTGETWSGRGRTARWLAAAEKAGRKRADFLVKTS